MLSIRLPAIAAGAALSACMLPGCATFSADGGFSDVAAQAKQQRGVEARWLRSDAERRDAAAQVAERLAQPLSADDAVQIALLDNRELQARFEELRLSEADLVRSGRLPNPSISVRHAESQGLYSIEQTLTFNVLALLTLPYAHGIDRRRFAEVQQSLVLAITALGDATRRAYYVALAARDSRRYAEQVEAAAQAGGELAARMQQAGNWNALEAARERDFAVAAAQHLARAQLAELDAFEALDRLMGLAAPAAELHLAEQLPAMPATPDEASEPEQAALDARIDLRIMRLRLDQLARGLKLTQATRFVNVLDAGPSRVREGTRDDPYETGYAVSVEIPLFDGGSAQVVKAEAVYARAADRFAQAAVQARSEVRAAYARVRTSYAIAARQKADVLPLQQSISEQNLLRYNAGQISVFELLADARLRIDAVDTYIQDLRDYWIARSALDSALIGNQAAATADAPRG